MHRKAVGKKKIPIVQKVDTRTTSSSVENKVSAGESNSPLMLVLNEENEKTLALLEEEMQNRLVALSELKVQIEKLVENALDEYAKIRGSYQRLQALEWSRFGGTKRKSRKSSNTAGPDIVKLDHSLLQEVKTDRIRQDVENLQAIKHLLKSTDGLLDTSAAISSRRSLTGSAAAKKKILIVEDDPISRRLLGHFLEKANYSVTNAVNAEEGVLAVGKEKPDLILLDIILPGVDGFQFLSRLNENEAALSPPVFVISSLSNEADIVRALQSGATDYILKPFSPQVILAKISQLFRVGR